MSAPTYPNGFIDDHIYQNNKKLGKLLKQLPIGYKGEFKELLEDLQANILKSHKRNYSGSLFIHFTHEKQALEWIEQLSKSVTSAKAQFDDRQHTEPVTCFYMTYKGYDALGLKHICPYVGNHKAFLEGMDGRIGLESEPVNKDPNLYPSDGNKSLCIHAMLFIADHDPTALDTMMAAHQSSLRGMAKTTLQNGLMKYNDQGKAVEWFGFRDGISQPQFFPDAAENKRPVVHKDDLTPLETALIYDRGGDSLLSTGSFLAFLKIEQDRKAFNGMVDTVAAAAKTTDKELAAAYILGRFRNGDPVTLHGQPTTARTKTPDNDFDYSNSYLKATSGNKVEYLNDEKGSRCPLHAHIRKANPRLGGEENNKTIVRRGILYDDRASQGPKSNEWQPDDVPTTDAGMLFMSFQSSLDKQFEYIMNRWMLSVNNGMASSISGVDMLVGAKSGLNPSRWYVPTSWNSPDPNAKNLVELNQGCVRLKGGEYFFAPSISFLKKVSKKTMRLNLRLGSTLQRTPTNQ